MRYREYEYAIAIEGSAGSGQDRATVVPSAGGLILALADGAGGTSNAAAAAQAVIDSVQRSVTGDLVSVLLDLDDPERLQHGETTAVLISIRGQALHGASVGDSGAWIVEQRSFRDLTQAQRRKPLLGAGCSPVAFADVCSPGSTLLIASDGLLRYARASDVVSVTQNEDLEVAAAALVNLARLPSGRLSDDVSVILCRPA